MFLPSTVGQGKGFPGDMVDCGPVPSLAAGTSLISGWQAGDRWSTLEAMSPFCCKACHRSGTKGACMGTAPLIWLGELPPGAAPALTPRAEPVQDMEQSQSLSQRELSLGLQCRIPPTTVSSPKAICLPDSNFTNGDISESEHVACIVLGVAPAKVRFMSRTPGGRTTSAQGT